MCTIDSPEKLRKALSLTPIDDVWGVGWRYAPKLISMGVDTALDFTQRPESWVRAHMGTPGVRTWLELQGTPAVGDETDERRKSICTSRSFADMITDKEELVLRVSDFAGICASKLRAEGSAALRVGVFAHTNRFRDDLPQHCPFEQETLPFPANSTQEIVSAALRALDRAWKPGYAYKRAGVTVDGITDAAERQGVLFEEPDRTARRGREETASALMDKFNTPGSKVLRLGTQRGGHYSEGIRREHCSGLFTTDWNQIIEIR